MHTPRFIYFDLDDTLLDHRAAERRALVDVCRDHEDVFGGIEPSLVQETYHTHNVDVWRHYARGDLTKDQVKRMRFERLLEALAVDGAEPHALNDHYLSRYADHWTYVEGARAAFEALADRYRVGILTNGFSEVQAAKLERFPELRARADTVVVSEEVGFMKPHPRIFTHATEAAGVDAGDVLYVGDSFTSDVEGGRRAGWQVAWFRGEAARVDGDDGVFCFEAWNDLAERLVA